MIFFPLPLQACDYALGVSSGVSLSIRKKLLAVQVQCKQVLRQPISTTNYEIDEVREREREEREREREREREMTGVICFPFAAA